MDIKTIRTEISQLLGILNEQWEMIQQNEGHIPQIEVDLFKATIRDLYDALLNLHRKNDEVIPVPPPERQQPASETSPSAVREALNRTPQPEIAETTTIPPVIKEPYREEPRKSFSETQNIPFSHEETTVFPHPNPQPQTREVPLDKEFSFRPPKPEPDLFSPGGPTISDKLKEEKTTLNQRLQQDSPLNTIGARLNQNPIKDLKSSIGINEKFQFINELFNGSMQDYTQAVVELNQFPNYEEALKLIDILKFKFNWDINSDAYHKIMDFVRRRYL